MFAVGTSFAADENVTLGQGDDEITVDNEVLSVEEDAESLNVDESSDVVAASNVVTNNTFHNYFDENGTLLDTVSDDELIFEGNFTGIDVDYLNINKSIKLTGNNAIFNGVSFNINANNVVIDGFSLTQTSTYLFSIEEKANVTISNNVIDFEALSDQNNYVVFAKLTDNLKIINNNISYVSTTASKRFNNVISVEGDSIKGASKNILVDNNNFTISIPSVPVRYGDEWYEGYPYDEGIKFTFCENLNFTNNKIDLQYSSYSNGADTINVVSVRSIFVDADFDDDYNLVSNWNVSKNVVISNNEINAVGHNYIYGIYVAANNFDISDNKLNISSVSYVAGLSIDGPSSNGTVANNDIYAESPSDVYGVYSCESLGVMWGSGSDIQYVTYKNNNIIAVSSNTCGMELFESFSTVSNNTINLEGNYTWGIVQSNAKNSVISDNHIYSLGTNSNIMGSGDPILPSNSMGISIKGSALIENNDIFSTDIGVNLVEAGNVVINNNRINVESNNDTKNNYAIYAAIDSLNITNNKIKFKGKSNGEANSDAIYVNGVDGVVISNNEMNVTVTGGKGSAINVAYADDPILSGNTIDYECQGLVNYGSNNVVTVGYGCNNANILDNKIVASGSVYTYGIYIVGSNFTIEKNDLDINSDEYYACGISVEPGLTKGMIKENTIDVKAIGPGYGIYSFGYEYGGYSAYSKDISYEDNVITVNAYLANPLQLCEDNSYVYNNKLFAYGNLTCGIFEKVSNNGKAIILNNTIVSNASEIHSEPTGDSYLTNESVSSGIDASGNVLIQGNNIFSSAIGIELVISGNSTVAENEINVAAENDTADNYAILASDIDSLNITGNEITFAGKSNGDAISRALSISYVDGVIVSNNTFDITIPSCGYSYVINDNPAKGIAFSNAAGLIFDDNVVDLKYDGVIGSWDTINVIEIGYGSDDAVISNNLISALGGSYVYGIKVYGKNFNISENTLTVTSELKYANGVNPEGGATGLVENNTIVAIGVESSYPIYSGMYGSMGNLDVDYIGNQIYGKAYYVVAVELGGANENVINNTIIAEGNYTIGIGSNSDNNTISGNIIKSLGTSIGNQSVWDDFGLVTTGVKVLKANANISNNTIEVQNGDYAIDLNNTDSTVDGNYLASKKTVGEDAIANPGSGATITNLSPSLKTILSAVEFHTVYDAGDVFYVTALDENGDPIKNATIFLTINGTIINETTGADGVATFFVDEWDVGDYLVTLTYKGNETYGPKSITTLVSIEKRVSNIVAPTSVNVLLTAVKKGSYYTITLKDDRDNGLAGEKVSITFNGKTNTYTTDDLGVIKFKLSATKAGTQKLTVKFDSNSNYVDSTLTATVKINKEATKLTAKKKTFKAKVKTKKYTVTLKDSKGKAIKKVKVTLKIKGKTYKAKTNAKGKATFKIKKLTKKGKYTAKVKFAGNNLYKAASKSVKITVKK